MKVQRIGHNEAQTLPAFQRSGLMDLRGAARTCVRGVAFLALTLVVTPLFLRAAPPDGGPSAEEILKAAKAQAKAEHKNILLEFGASWCGNCKLYERLLNDPAMHPILSKAFVIATMDTGERASDTKHANTPGGLEFENSVGGKGSGWPFLVILDANGKPIVDSYRPEPKAKSGKDNIGYPATPEEIDWFVEMLRRSAPVLTKQDLANVHAWLTEHSPVKH